MATYLEVDLDKWVKIENERATVLFPVSLQEELAVVNQRLSELPPEPSEAELLAWARLNYPGIDYSRERGILEARRMELDIDLTNMGF